jgi:hypothetical protein
MIVNFKAREISRGMRKLTRTLMLIKKKYKAFFLPKILYVANLNFTSNCFFLINNIFFKI